jgi:hypothetical protein
VDPPPSSGGSGGDGGGESGAAADGGGGGDAAAAAAAEADGEAAERRGAKRRKGGSGGGGGGKGGGKGGPRPEWVLRVAGGGPPVRARTVVLATGGLSFPAVGTDGTGEWGGGQGSAAAPRAPLQATLLSAAEAGLPVACC